MKKPLSKLGWSTLSIIGLGAITIPSSLSLIACTSSITGDQPDSKQTDKDTSAIISISQATLTQLQNQANAINTIPEAISFLNQILAKYYSFEMLKNDLIKASIVEYQFDGPHQNWYDDSIYKTGLYQISSQISNVRPNPDHQSINFTWTYTTHTNYMGDGSVVAQFYNLPIKPILVKQDKTIRFKLAFGLGKGLIRQCQEPQGNGCKSFTKQFIETDDFIPDMNELPFIADNFFVSNHHLFVPVGTTTYWNQYSPNLFNQKLIYHYDLNHPNPVGVQTSKINQVWSQSNPNQHPTWVSCFDCSLLPLTFPKLS